MPCHHYTPVASRRDFLRTAGCGFGAVALAALTRPEGAPLAALVAVAALALRRPGAGFGRRWCAWVAVFLAIRLVNRAAVASFSHFTEALAGRSDWVLQPPAGTLPETVLGELQAALADHPVQLLPVVETTAAVDGLRRELDDL